MEIFNSDLLASDNLVALLTGIGILVGCTAIGTLGFFVLGRRDWLTWILLLVSIAVGGLIGWGVGNDIIEAKNNDARLDFFTEQVEEVYGIKLDRETAEKLNPPFSTPISGYQEFGRAEVPFLGQTMPVILVYNEGVLFLGVDGSNNSLPTLEDIEEQGLNPVDGTPLDSSVPDDSEPAPGE